MAVRHPMSRGELDTDLTIKGAWTFDVAQTFKGNVTIDDADLIITGATAANKRTDSHDDTDFNSVFANTADWNISGITAIKAGTVDADFDAITATSYDGVLAANLLSKIAAESISADWTWGSGNDIIFDGGTQTFKLNHTDAATNFTGTGTHLNVILGGGGAFRLRTGTPLRIFNSGNTDSVQISHDGTDCNFDGTNTTDLNISGMHVKFVNNVGFYNTAPIAKQTGVAVTDAGIHAALVNLGLIT